MNNKRIWILGASDPEMGMIEKILRASNEHVIYALTTEGKRVHPGCAYQAYCEEVRGFSGTIYEIECAVSVLHGFNNDGIDSDATVETIDHHRKGDVGFGQPPPNFFRASSIGQVIRVLGLHIRYAWVSDFPGKEHSSGRYYFELSGNDNFIFSTPETLVETTYHDTSGIWTAPWPPNFDLPDDLSAEDIILTAAADHCLGAAYQGKCPSVVPDNLMRFRAEERAKFQNKDVESILNDIKETTEAIKTADIITLTGSDCSCFSCTDSNTESRSGSCDRIEIADMRKSMPQQCPFCGNMPANWNYGCPGCGANTSIGTAVNLPPWPELPEAACRAGVGYIAGPLVCPDGRDKITCSGSKEQVEAFMNIWAIKNGLVNIYGDPVRGFAGGYLTKQ
jgi:hypothetical protein